MRIIHSIIVCAVALASTVIAGSAPVHAAPPSPPYDALILTPPARPETSNLNSSAGR